MSDHQLHDAKSISDLVQFEKLSFLDDDPIGCGAFGEVFKAFHIDWGCQVAYKKLPAFFISSKPADRKIEKSLKNEAAIHRLLRHPNIVSMLGIVFERGNYGILLEYVFYGSLGDFMDNVNNAAESTDVCYYKTGSCVYLRSQTVIDDGQPVQRFAIPWILKCRMIHEILCGMSYLHMMSMPVIHGDLKLQNILVDEHLHAKISDFGFAKWKDYSRSRTKVASTPSGTPSHIPPETWKRSDLKKDEKFDVYSFAMLLWEFFTEKKAFEGCQEMIFSMVIAGKRPPLTDLPSDLPLYITEMITKAWDQEPQNRPSCTAMMKDLCQHVSGCVAEAKIKEAANGVLHIYSRHPSVVKQSDHGRIMERVWEKLRQFVRRIRRILAHLLEHKALTPEEHKVLCSQQNEHSVLKLLLTTLSEKSVKAYHCFLDALNKTDQQHLYKLLTEEDYEINMVHKTKLIDKYTFLMRNIAPSEVLKYLLQDGILDDQEVEEIESKTTTERKVEELLSFIMRMSPEQYGRFLNCLSQANHGFVLDELRDSVTGTYQPVSCRSDKVDIPVILEYEEETGESAPDVLPDSDVDILDGVCTRSSGFSDPPPRCNSESCTAGAYSNDLINRSSDPSLAAVDVLGNNLQDCQSSTNTPNRKSPIPDIAPIETQPIPDIAPSETDVWCDPEEISVLFSFDTLRCDIEQLETGKVVCNSHSFVGDPSLANSPCPRHNLAHQLQGPQFNNQQNVAKWNELLTTDQQSRRQSLPESLQHPSGGFSDESLSTSQVSKNGLQKKRQSDEACPLVTNEAPESNSTVIRETKSVSPVLVPLHSQVSASSGTPTSVFSTDNGCSTPFSPLSESSRFACSATLDSGLSSFVEHFSTDASEDVSVSTKAKSSQAKRRKKKRNVKRRKSSSESSEQTDSPAMHPAGLAEQSIDCGNNNLVTNTVQASLLVSPLQSNSRVSAVESTAAQLGSSSITGNVERLKCFDTNGGSVCGIALLQERIYVAFKESNMIACFNADTLAHLNNMVVAGVKCDLEDLIGCNTNRFLYAIGDKRLCVYRIAVENRKSVAWIRSRDYISGRLSVTAKGNVLVLTPSPPTLSVYNPNATVAHTIRLPHENSIHAVKLPSKNFLVSHCGGAVGSGGIFEMNKNGDKLRAYGGHRTKEPGLHRPEYITVDHIGNVFIADSGHNRVLSLDSALDLVTAVVRYGINDPHRLLYNHEKRRLFVGFEFGGRIDVLYILPPST